MKRGRPKTTARKYPRDKRLTEKYPTLPERPVELDQEGPRNNEQERQWDAWIAEATRAIRTTVPHYRPQAGEPYEIPVIAMSEVLGSESRRGSVR